MPKATVTQETVNRILKSCPPDGFVELRTLSFHEMNTRSDIASRMYSEQKPNVKKPKEEVVRGYLEIMNVAVTEFEFRNCITDHNLEDENGNPIDFTRPMQAWRLDPKIGQEIGKYIDELNNFDDEEEDLDPLVMPDFSSSPDEASSQSLTTVET
jgi:hypothetical protein